MAKAKAGPDVFAVVQTRLDGIRLLLEDMDAGAAEGLVRMILRANRVFVTGKGRSGLVAECFAMRLMQMGFDAHVPGEATCPRIRRGDLMIAVSCSGATASIVQFARISADSGARVAAVTAIQGSPLTEVADDVVLVPVTGKDVKERYRSVLGPHNNTLFEEALLLYFDAMVCSILESEGIPKRRLTDRHTNLE